MAFSEPVTDQRLLDLIEKAKDHVMTPEEVRAQRISWVRGQIWDREVSEEEAARVVDGLPPVKPPPVGG